MDTRMIARVGALALSLSLSVHSAFAQTDFERQEAQARFDEGNKLYALGRYEEARVKFTQAWATLKRPNVLFNLARAEQLSGKSIDAARHYRAYARMSDPKITPAQKKETADHLAEVGAHVGRLAITVPSGATVTVDGERLDDAALAEPVEVPVGRHVIVATLGAEKRDQSATVAAGATIPIAIAFEEPPRASERAAGGDRHVVEPPPVSPGRTFWDAPRWAGVGAVGAGLVAIGAGVAFGGSARDHRDRGDALQSGLGPGGCAATPAPPSCGELTDARSAQDRDATLSKIFVGVGVAASAVGVALLVWPRGTADAAIAPSVGKDGAGMILSGTF